MGSVLSPRAGGKAKAGGVRFAPSQPAEGAPGHVHFQEQLRDSAVMVTQEKDGHFLVKVGFGGAHLLLGGCWGWTRARGARGCHGDPSPRVAVGLLRAWPPGGLLSTRNKTSEGFCRYTLALREARAI